MTNPTAIRARIAGPAAALLLSILFLLLPALTARAAVDIQAVTSDKGIHAWLVEDYTVPIVTIRFVFDGGTAQDPPGKEGLANLMTGLFDEGAGDLDSDAFQARLDEVGAEMRFEANRDGIYGSMRVLADSRHDAFGLLRLALGQPRFDAEPVERVRGQVLSGILAKERDPNTIAQAKWLRAIYGDHPYGRQDEGTSQSVTAITVQHLRDAHKAMFARDGLHVAVVGAIGFLTLSLGGLAPFLIRGLDPRRSLMLGAERLVHGHVGPAAFTLRIDGTRQPPHVGQTVHVAVEATHLHWFDPTDGRRVA